MFAAAARRGLYGIWGAKYHTREEMRFGFWSPRFTATDKGRNTLNETKKHVEQAWLKRRFYSKSCSMMIIVFCPQALRNFT